MLKNLLITTFLILTFSYAHAACRKDTIYYSTIENSINYPQKRIINTYNSNNQISQLILQYWNTGTKKYDNSDRTSTTYNTNGYRVEVVSERWSSNVWVNDRKNNYTYNSDNKITQNIGTKWNKTLQKWDDYSKYIATITSSYKTSLSSDWNYYGNNTWDIRYKDSIVFNNKKNDSLNFRYVWDNITKTWEPLSFFKYTYNSLNDIETEIELDWNNNQWENYYRTSYTYNSNRQIIQQLAEDYNGPSGIYVDYRITHSYNSSNNLIQTLEEDWNPNNLVWENYSKEVYLYDGSNNLFSKSEYSGWDNTQKQYTLELREDYKCSNISSIRSIEKKQFEIYPNPANSNLININVSKASQYRLFDFLGKIIQTGLLNATENKIALPIKITNGIYFIQIGNTTQTIIINR